MMLKMMLLKMCYYFRGKQAATQASNGSQGKKHLGP